MRRPSTPGRAPFPVAFATEASKAAALAKDAAAILEVVEAEEVRGRHAEWRLRAGRFCDEELGRGFKWTRAPVAWKPEVALRRDGCGLCTSAPSDIAEAGATRWAAVWKAAPRRRVT